MILTITLLAAVSLAVPVELPAPAASSAIRFTHDAESVRAEWLDSAETRFVMVFSLDPAKPLFESVSVGGVTVARQLRPRFTITTGSRIERPNERYIFFDKPASRPTTSHEASLTLGSVRGEMAGNRAALIFSGLTAGPFSGDLRVHLYAGSPFIHVEAAMQNSEPRTAYIYDFALEGRWRRAAWIDHVTDQWVEAEPGGDVRPVGVRFRTIFAEADRGAVAIFPAPHAFFFPRDHTVNFKFAQVGKGRIGLRQDPAGGPGHQGAFIPWFDAPVGKTQRMSAFLLPGPGSRESILERVRRYTHGDAFKGMEGRFTFTSHWHVRLAVNEMAERPVAPEVSKVFKKMNVNIVHLAEFHGDGNPADPGPKRLPQLKAMFDVCRKYSDAQLLFIPGEEANAHLNVPPPPNTHPGHWMYLFPRPVYLTLVRGPGVPFVEEIPPYGTVYHAGSEADMVEILRREKALAWTAHPRIKASFACPDSYKEKEWFQDNLWLGAAWKAMPADLSEPRLGVRVLDLLDDMNTWGKKKQVLGEVDTFELDSTHELYGHMNINYLKLDKMPAFDDWSPVLGALRRGDFFTSTGEVLIHHFDVSGGKVKADLEWTFPLSQVWLVSWDGQQIKRRIVHMPQTREFQRQTFEWSIDGNPIWIRLEAWDIAINGAFTQPLWLR